MRQKWITLSFILCMLLSCAMTVFAQDLDFERKGSVSVTLTDQEESVPIVGAKFALYRVADIESDGSGSWKYVLEDVFQEAGIVIDDPAVTIKLERFGFIYRYHR